MGDSGDRPDSPPLPRGSYNINFDELDDSIDPFKPRGGLSNSPGKEISNPFQTKSKIASSPPKQSVPNPVVENHQGEAGDNMIEMVNGEQESSIDRNISRSPAIDIQKPKKGKKKKVKKEQNESAAPPLENIDYDEENPFKTKSKIGQSPPGEENPFISKTKLQNSPPKDGDNLLEESSFQTKSKLGASPPGGQAFIQETPVETSENRTAEQDIQNESLDSFKTAEESPDKSNNGLKTRAKSQTPPTTKIPGDSVPEDVRDSELPEPKPAKTEKKTASPKKSGIKKPKARSKFKPPPNFGVQESEDVVIFAPPASKSANNDTSSDQAPADNDETGGEQPVSEQSQVGTNQMPAAEVIGGVNDMIDSVHDFGACEMPMESNEDFVPASEAFNDEEAWDIMEKMKHENGAPIRESLTPFDPLAEQEVPDKVTRRSSEGVIDGNSHIEDEDLLLMNTPPQQKQHSGSSRGVSRHPAARALQQHVDGDGAPKEAHVVDKMLFSPVRGEDGKSESDVERMNVANKKHGTPTENSQDNIVQLVQVLKYSQSDWNKMKQDLELDFNARILNKEREWSKKLADRDKKISYLEEQVLLLRSSNEDMKCVVTEFEKTIAQLQAEKLKTTTESQQGYEDLVKERDQALEDLQSVETAFSDLHQRYERTKGVVEGFKKNEEVLKKCVLDYQNKLKAAEEKTVSVRQQAEEKLALASDEMDKLRKSTTSEVARLEAALKKTELKIQGLERSLEQKIQENNELTAICDELIAKVSTD